MADAAEYRELLETAEYSAQLESFAQAYSDEVLEAALQGVLWGIATNPDRYERVTANPDIWMARARSFNDDDPCFKIFFGIPNSHQVLLLWIEEIRSIDEIG
jgi:hypothetical protein